METIVLARHAVLHPRPHRIRAVGMNLLLALALSSTALGQQQPIITGTVTSQGGYPLRGVTVQVQGTEIRAQTNERGRYSVAAPPTGTLSFTVIGMRPVEAAIAGRTLINVTMQPIAYLEQVVVTSYSEQRRSDITGAVASINVENVSKQTGASVLQKLDAVAGITVAASGSPGARSTVRIRGISSFQNNDPLYIVDGMAVSDSYINWLNPNDIESVQVLKDASSASIYGSRASNGVVIIETTKKGGSGPPRARLTMKVGQATPTRGYDDFLITNALDYFKIVKESYTNAGLPVPTNVYGDPSNPTIPQYIFAASGTSSTDQYGRPTGVDLSKYSYPNSLIMPGSPGTNWWEAVFGPAMVGDYNLSVSGGGVDNAYGVSFNFFDQNGTAAYNNFRRGSIRVNTSFTRRKLTVGENVALSLERHTGGLPDDPGGYAEDGILGKNILMQPVVPIRDIKGNFASGKAVGLGNTSNPLKQAFEARDNINRNNRVFGNVFGSLEVTPTVFLRTSLGFNVAQQGFTGFNPIFPENSEPSFTNSINENSSSSTDWSWSNTLRTNKVFFSKHNISLLLGQEANAGTNRFLTAGISSLLNSDPNSRFVQDALGDAATKVVTSTGGKSSQLGFFGKADYNYSDKYVASVTVRRDGSSRLGPQNRWGTFPAFGLGWRITKEPWAAGKRLVSDAMLRFGWGVTGNQAIPSGRIVSQFGGDRGDTYYDITGSNSSVVAGFRQTSLGNANLKWEENKSTNVGADLALFDGRINVVVDVYQRKTNNLLFDPRLPGTAGIAAPPIVNIGQMKNQGVDFSIGHQGRSWDFSIQGSHYKNEIVSIDGVQDFFYGPISTRYGNQVINKVGYPIGSFFGLISQGFFRDAADVAAHAKQDGAAPGRIKFKDVNGDGSITADDRTIIGNPHPDFSAGLDVGFRWKDWDLTGSVFGSFGNDIFDVQKEFYVFRNFSTNVRKDLLTDSWTPTHTNAKYPRLDVNDTYSHTLSDYYVEDGSYVRMRSIQLGYNVPQRYARWMSATRVYLQAENLFTISGYDGLDPALPAANIFGPAGDVRDQYRGIDRGSYPSSRTFSIGIVTSF